jgi:hypothetical protein
LLQVIAALGDARRQEEELRRARMGRCSRDEILQLAGRRAEFILVEP